MPNPSELNQHILQVADQQHIDNPAHLLVESMASPQLVANSEAGRNNFDAEAIRKLKGAGHNYDDTLTLEQNLARLHPSKSKPEDLERLNGQLENTVVVDSHISGGGGNFWTARW